MFQTPTQTPQGSPYGSQAPWQYAGEPGQVEFMQRVLANFGASLLIAAGGAAAAWHLPPDYYFGLIALEFVLLLAAIFARSSTNVSALLVYAFAAVSGATTVPLIQWAIHYTGGPAVVFNALAVTGAMFCGLAWYGNTTRKDLSGWSTFLWMGLIGACVICFIGLFVPFGTPMQLLISVGIVIVFAGFTAYDINQIKANWRNYSVTTATLNLYLDFLNLFVNVLRILAILSGNGGGRRD